MRIIITGCPGTGKSAIAKRLSEELGLPLVGIKKIVDKNKLADKHHEVDLKKLATALKYLAGKDNYVAEGHLACEIRLPNDFVIVLRTNPKALKRRLSKRKYSKSKAEDNVLAEVLDYCTQRVETVYRRRPLELDTSGRSVSKCVKIIRNAIKQKKKKIDSVDFTYYLSPG